MPSTSTSTSPTLRYFKVPNKDRFVPGYVLRASDSGQALFIIVEAPLATASAQLLGDDVHFFNLANKPYLGAWISGAHKAHWRVSADTVPIGKSIGSQGDPLLPEDIPVDLQLPELPKHFEEGPAPEDDLAKEFMSLSSKGGETGIRTSPVKSAHKQATSPQSPLGVSGAAPVSTSGVYYEEPLYVVLPNEHSPVDGKVIHHARTAANAAAVPNGKIFSGIDDVRPISDILKAANEAAAYNAWTAVEYYFFLIRIVSEEVRRKICPQPQPSAAAYGSEVHRLCSLLHNEYSSETELVQALFRWNSLVMGDKQSLSEYLKFFEQTRQQVERLQGSPIDDRVLKHKLLMTLPNVHREVGLTKMSTVGYHGLLHELIQLDRVRQLATAHRKSGHLVSSKAVNSVDANYVAPDNRQPERRRGDRRPAPSKPKRWSCLRCLDTVEPPGHHHRNCPSPNPVEKDGRCVHCNRTIGSGKNCCQDPSKCTASTNRKCPRCAAEGQHHPFHCPGSLPPSQSNSDNKQRANTTSLTFENVLIAGTTTPVPTSSLRSTTLKVLSSNGTFPFTGLIDTGAEMTAMSQSLVERLISAGVHVPKPRSFCTALMADGKPIRECPIHNLTFVHGSQHIVAPVVVIRGLSKDALVSADLFRQFNDPTLWLFSKTEDRLVNLGSLDPELRRLWDIFFSKLETRRLSPSTDTVEPLLNDVTREEDCEHIGNSSASPDVSNLPQAPVIYGISLEGVTDNSVANDYSICTTYADPSAVDIDMVLPTRYKHKIKWLRPKPTNNVQALRKQADRLEARLRREGILDLYDAEIKKFEQKGYIKPIDPNYAKFCLNHFPVVRKHGNELSSMKVRPVFDGSSLRGIVSPNISDSDKQHVTSSIYLLRRFRHFISCDFQAAFLQVEYESEEDRRYLCFWWRGILYSYQRVLFGLPDSPGALIHSLDDNLCTSRAEIRQALQVDDTGEYGLRILMDDLSIGASSHHLAHEVLKIVLRNAAKRGFEENEAKRVESEGGSAKSGSMLGYHWSSNDDTLIISACASATRLLESVETVGDYRKFLATFFDPCGLYLEYMMKARLHLQESGMAGKTNKLTAEQKSTIQDWLSMLRSASPVPRLLYPDNHDFDTIIAFVDASNKASAVIVETLGGCRIWARGFVTPVDVKPTAPRMELDALCTSSTLLKNFIVDVTDYWGINKLIICTDSEVNLARLRRTSTTIKTPDELVRQRRVIKIRNTVHELQQKTSVRVLFTHIEGALNPADLPSRGKISEDIHRSAREAYVSYLVGLLRSPDTSSIENLPSFYTLPQDYTPIPIPSKLTPAHPEAVLAIKASQMNSENDAAAGDDGYQVYQNEDIASQLHQQRRLSRAFREWQKYCMSLGDPHHQQDPILSPLVMVVGKAQHRYGQARLLRAPFTSIDDNGLIVRHCRQDTNGLVHPQYVVPPKDRPLQRLIVKTVHGHFHHGVNATYNELVKMFHWPGIRPMVAKVVTACGVCIKIRPRRLAIQGSTPKKIDRVPWSTIGVDHCGAYDNNGDKQKYLVVCTDLLTGYIDAEPTTSTTAMQLITAVKRIFSRSGIPRRICTDRGQAYLSGVFRLFTSTLNIQHHLVPPGSPHYGGKWERSHGPLNENLKMLRTTQSRLDWRTLVAEAVSLSNRRPRWSTISSWDLMHTYPQDQTQLCAPRPERLLEEWIEGFWEDDRARVRERLGDKAKEVNVGDHVYLRTPSPMKLGELARGPYVVEEVRGHTYLSTNKKIQQPLYKLITTK
ncbi:hypothetical protein FOL47_005556 [Perkinsus chesapeaki]|uniref:Integrase catalytic domain-containing protein n=1 Tax=Perkinsus chesapeaki TaxID=330153 RepID=A0A7J6LWX2_PERCH|nr:hypothetical protein FOL47_005556 [Perkinsus chesapeaki]